MAPSSRPSVKRFAILATLLLLVTGAIGAAATASDPDQGTLSLEQRQLTWSGETTGAVVGYPEPRIECTLEVTATCDRYTLDVDIDPAHWDTNAGGAEVLIAWENPENDFDLVVYQGTTKIGESAQSDTTSERVFIPSASRDGGAYTVLVSPFKTDESGKYGGGVRLETRAAVPADSGGEVPDEKLTNVPCENGAAGPFPCRNVDLASFLPVSELGGSRPLPQLEELEPTIGGLVNDGLNDIWGWTDPQTKREYALVGKTDGVAFVDVTNPTDPVYRGQLVSRQSLAELVPIETIYKTWRDLKVYKDHVFIGSEEPNHGLQVFDLTKLRGEEPITGWTSDAGYDGFGNSHNIAINEDSGFLYAIGTNTCAGGPHIVDIRDPKAPKEAGCVDQDGYTHDTQCVNYDGPDANYRGREICFSSNEDSVTVVDVTDKANPQQLSRVEYDGAAYTHQGWLNKDATRLLVNDELDEQNSGVTTTTRIFNVEKLNAVSFAGAYSAKVNSIDHNLYVKNDTVYEANYRSGLRVLDARGAKAGKLSETGFFDVYPADDEAEFNGAWSNYPYFPSGTVIVSGIEQGLFVLRPNQAAGGADGKLGDDAAPASQPAPAAAASTAAQTSCATDAGFRTVGVQPFGRTGGLELEFKRRAASPVDVDVFQQAIGRRVVGERLVARFKARADDVRWNGKATVKGRKVTAGHYFARYRIKTPTGVDTRRVALKLVKGRWTSRADFHRRASCDLLRSFKLGRPVFGGTRSTRLGIAFQTAADARAQVTVTKGSKVVRRFAAKQVKASRTTRMSLAAKGLARGTYRVRISVRRGTETVTSMLSAERL